MGARSCLGGLFQLMVLPKASAPARGPSSHQDRQLGAGGRCVSPLRRVVSMVLCGSARLVSQSACSASLPVLEILERSNN